MLHLMYPGLGGLATYFKRFTSSDDLHRFEHRAVFFGVEPLTSELREHCEKNNIEYLMIEKRPGLDVVSYVRLMKALLESRAGVFAVHSYAGAPLVAFASWIGRAKIAAFEHTPPNARPRGEAISYRIMRHIASLWIVFQGEGWTPLLLPGTLRLRTASLVRVEKAVDVTARDRAEVSDGRSGVHFGMVSRLVDDKDHATLIEGYEIFLSQSTGDVSTSLLIAGDGPSHASLARQIERLGVQDHVRLVGRLRHVDVSTFLRDLDVYVHATKGETVCYAILEAQAEQLPVVASDVEGVRDAVRDGVDGLLVPGSDPKAMAAAFVNLASDPQLRFRMGRSARERAIARTQALNHAEVVFRALTAIGSGRS